MLPQRRMMLLMPTLKKGCCKNSSLQTWASERSWHSHKCHAHWKSSVTPSASVSAYWRQQMVQEAMLGLLGKGHSGREGTHWIAASSPAMWGGWLVLAWQCLDTVEAAQLLGLQSVGQGLWSPLWREYFGRKHQAHRVCRFLRRAKEKRGVVKRQKYSSDREEKEVMLKDFLAEPHYPPGLSQLALSLPLQSLLGCPLFSRNNCFLSSTLLTLFLASSLKRITQAHYTQVLLSPSFFQPSSKAAH